MAASDRRDDARARLLEAGLDVFGRLGFEAASTRQLAERAGVALSAIPYHFGGKAELYQAVADSIADRVESLVGPLAAQTVARLERERLSRRELVDLALDLLVRFAAIVVASPDADRWARFVLREQMDPTPAFDVLYERVMARLHGLLCRIVGRLRDQPAEAEDTCIRAFALLGQVLVFRAARAAVLRRLEWTEIGDEELDALRPVLEDHVRAILMRPRRASR